MADESSPNGTVSYTVKELLARQDGKLDAIIVSLNSKADRTEVTSLESRVGNLETAQAQNQGSSTFQRWAAPIMISLGVLVLGGLTFILNVATH